MWGFVVRKIAKDSDAENDKAELDFDRFLKTENRSLYILAALFLQFA
jgi:hypothetical protein